MKPATHSNQRIHQRFDKVFAVQVSCDLFGDSPAIARNISAGGMLVEVTTPLPMGTIVSVRFSIDRPDGPDELIATAEVKHHYCLNFEERAARAMGLKFLSFDDRAPLVLPSMRSLH